MFIKYQKRLIAINRPKKRAADKWDSPRLISSFLALSFSYSQALSKLRPLAANANRYYYRYLQQICNESRLQISAIYRRNFNSQIFTDITTPVKQSYSPNTGKKTQVLTSPISRG